MKTKKKNKFLPLIVLVLIFALLLIGYKILSAANEQREQEEYLASLAADETIAVSNYDLATMTALSYQPRGADPLSFRVVNGAWQWADDPLFPLDPTALANMGTSIASITASRTVDEGTPADYGLDDPACTVTVEYGTDRHVYLLGDYNSFAASYYLMTDGVIYLTPTNLNSYFNKTLDELLLKDSIPAADWTTRDYVSAVTVRADGKENTITDADGIDEILTALGNVVLRVCTDYNATDDEMASYGFDGSTGITVNYRKAVTVSESDGSSSTNYLDTSYTLEVGGKVGHDEGYYVSPSNSAMVYSLAENTVLGLLAYVDYSPAE